ncbi:hypothetical protein [Alteriqipengyuania lutimaris]|uniref:hypothetical protein n=1 Tax=Alteriqipengyuania lutimaris TaxID=1538146 RepID=UPI00181D330C|nr:hypothetical protein [Alteriqipengyuania lutimaris]MBB3034502.1 hypothetical protein [Alteriqipengyuania lutimaris]
MSIRSGIFVLAHAAVALATPAAAQDGEDDVVGPLLERSREAYTMPEPEPERPADCAVSRDDTIIIVCAPIEDDPDRYRVSSRLEDGDDSHLSWNGEAPDVSGPGIFKGPATVSGLCIIPPCPPPPVYMIDVTALPEAPPGSDADRIARGLSPRGSRYDEGEAALDATAQQDGESPPDAPTPDTPTPNEPAPDEPGG